MASLRSRKFFCRSLASCPEGNAEITATHESIIQTAGVIANRPLCREHFRLTLRLPRFDHARPGQFVHLCPAPDAPPRTHETRPAPSCAVPNPSQGPMLRRAFSIAGLRAMDDGVEVDVIFRVVGAATRWMESLLVGDSVSLMGPLGNVFPIHQHKPIAWFVAGGVGLPPLLWFAEALHKAGKKTVAFCGAQSADLLPLTFALDSPPDKTAQLSTASAAEFAAQDATVVISTDDGSLGFPGHIGAALAAFHATNPTPADSVVLYTCGPERMMRFVADHAVEHGIECYACMERAMACGTGLCQSCVVPVSDEAAIDGWRYRLCCTDGPVFNAATVLWQPPA